MGDAARKASPDWQGPGECVLSTSPQDHGKAFSSGGAMGRGFMIRGALGEKDKQAAERETLL